MKKPISQVLVLCITRRLQAEGRGRERLRSIVRSTMQRCLQLGGTDEADPRLVRGRRRGSLEPQYIKNYRAHRKGERYLSRLDEESRLGIFSYSFSGFCFVS